MRNELSDRQQAIRMRLAGDSVTLISQTLRRSEAWVSKWWQRCVMTGGEGLYDVTRARHRIVNRTPMHIERAVLAIRRRLAARATPQTRYALLGSPTIQQELRSLGYTPLPTLRTIERILQRAHLTSPRVRLARPLPRNAYPGPRAEDSNQVHQIDLVGPRYLAGDRTKYYFYVCKDAFDQAVYAEFQVLALALRLPTDQVCNVVRRCIISLSWTLSYRVAHQRLERTPRTTWCGSTACR